MPTPYTLINNGDSGLTARNTINDILTDANNGLFTGATGAAGTSGSSGTSGTQSGCLGITIDGGGSVITTGLKGYLLVPYDCEIDCWGVIADQSGSIVVDVWKAAQPTIPTVANTITGTEKPTLSSSQIAVDVNLTSWATSLLFGDILAFNVDSASTLTRATIQIKTIKS